MNIYLANTLTALWYIFYPIGVLIYYIAILVLFLLKLLYRPIGFVLQPFIYLGRFLLACLLAPFHLLAKLETLYIYLGIAAIVGLIIGLVVSYAYGILSGLLRLDSKAEPTPSRSAKEYRKTKRQAKLKVETPLLTSPGVLSPNSLSPGLQSPPAYLSMSETSRKGKGRKGLLNQIIMEEVDSDY